MNKKILAIVLVSALFAVFIAADSYAYNINNAAGGGDCEGRSIGTWDSGTNTCTLNTNIFETIQIDSNGIILDCNNFDITGENTGHGIYLSGKTGVTIKNCNVYNFKNGIYLYSGSGNMLTGNTANNNNNNGIFIYSSSNYNTITNNIVNNNSWAGIEIMSSLSNLITDNTASNSGMGIILWDNSDNCTVTNNIAYDNRYDGIYLWSSFSKIESNIAYNNRNGITVSNAESDLLISNTVYNNREYGLFLGQNSDIALTDNTANYNNNGIILYSSFNNTFISNTVENNTNYGVYLDSASNNNILNYNNIDAVYTGGSGNDLTNNWWGSASPDCAKISGINCPADLSPWLTSPWTKESCKSAKQAQLDILKRITLANKNDDKNLKKAIKWLENSMDESKELKWKAECELYCQKEPKADGKKVFDYEQKSVKDLMNIKKPTAEILTAIKAITDVDKTLAKKAAEMYPDCKQDKVAKEMAKAESAYASGKYDKAVYHYRKAWQDATHCSCHPGKESCINQMTLSVFGNCPTTFTKANGDILYPETNFLITCNRVNYEGTFHTSCSRCIKAGDENGDLIIDSIMNDRTLAQKCTK